MSSHRAGRLVPLLGALAIWAGVLACSDAEQPAPTQVDGGIATRGPDVIRTYHCGSCHTIPGVKGADGLVGPPLIHWSRRGFIAGQLENKPDNLVRWLRDPKGVEPGTDMPDLGLTDTQARDVAAYLFTIR